jgi:SAM-dependent methyltransferase
LAREPASPPSYSFATGTKSSRWSRIPKCGPRRTRFRASTLVCIADASVDLIVAATAFHWFDADRSHGEFRRILKPGGYVVLLWNKRRSDSPFLHDYEDLLLRFGTDYKDRWGKQRVDWTDKLTRFFHPKPFTTHRLETSQSLDFEGLEERLLSSSYAPLPGAPSYEPMMTALHGLFQRFQHDGVVAMDYETLIYCGRL